MKRKVLLVTAVAWVPFMVMAQQAPADGKPGGRPDPEKMRQMFEERFRKADANGDGALSRAEAEQGMPMLARDFDKVDTNGDGKITREEIRVAMEKRRGEIKDKGGPGGPGGRPTREEMKARGAEMFRKADANGDGVLSEDEASRASPRLAQNFAAMDANKDGKLTRAEIDQYMQARRKEFESRRVEPPK